MSLLCWFTDDATLDLGYKLTAVLNHWVWAGEDTLRDSRSELESRRKKFVATQTQCEWHSNYELAPPPVFGNTLRHEYLGDLAGKRLYVQPDCEVSCRSLI